MAPGGLLCHCLSESTWPLLLVAQSCVLPSPWQSCPWTTSSNFRLRAELMCHLIWLPGKEVGSSTWRHHSHRYNMHKHTHVCHSYMHMRTGIHPDTRMHTLRHSHACTFAHTPIPGLINTHIHTHTEWGKRRFTVVHKENNTIINK